MKVSIIEVSEISNISATCNTEALRYFHNARSAQCLKMYCHANALHDEQIVQRVQENMETINDAREAEDYQQNKVTMSLFPPADSLRRQAAQRVLARFLLLKQI